MDDLSVSSVTLYLRIQDSLGGSAPTQRWYYFDQFSSKMHENQENWTLKGGTARSWRPLGSATDIVLTGGVKNIGTLNFEHLRFKMWLKYVFYAMHFSLLWILRRRIHSLFILQRSAQNVTFLSKFCVCSWHFPMMTSLTHRFTGCVMTAGLLSIILTAQFQLAVTVFLGLC